MGASVSATYLCECPACASPQDFLTAAYLLTSKDRFYSRAEVGLFVCAMGDAADAVELPLPALAKPLELWTGKQLFSLLIRPSARAKCALCPCWLKTRQVVCFHFLKLRAWSKRLLPTAALLLPPATSGARLSLGEGEPHANNACACAEHKRPVGQGACSACKRALQHRYVLTCCSLRGLHGLELCGMYLSSN